MVKVLQLTCFWLGSPLVPAVKAACVISVTVGLLRAMTLTAEVAPRITLWVVSVFAATLAMMRAWSFLNEVDAPRSECRRCRRGAMERAAASVTGTRYYRCSLCGARMRRANPLAAFEDASGIEYDAMYVRRARHGGLEISAPLDEPTYWTYTIETLHRNQYARRRHADAAVRKPPNPSVGRDERRASAETLWDRWLDGWAGQTPRRDADCQDRTIA